MHAISACCAAVCLATSRAACITVCAVGPDAHWPGLTALWQREHCAGDALRLFDRCALPSDDDAAQRVVELEEHNKGSFFGRRPTAAAPAPAAAPLVAWVEWEVRAAAAAAATAEAAAEHSHLEL